MFYSGDGSITYSNMERSTEENCANCLRASVTSKSPDSMTSFAGKELVQVAGTSNTQSVLFKVTGSLSNPTKIKFSSEFKFRYFANCNFAKFKFRLLFYFWKSLNDSFLIEIQKAKFANI